MKKLSIAVLAVLCLSMAVYGTTRLVPNQYPTIQAAINACVNGDTVLVADGTYTGAGNKNLDFGGRAIVVMSESDASECIIDCQSSGRGAYFHSGETSSAVLKGFTIRNGNSSYGGGINITGASPTIERCIIRGNTSSNSYGGGIYVSSGSPDILHCTLTINSSKYGGGIYATNSAMTVNSCIIVNNSASG